MGRSLWQRCLAKLECELPPQQFSTWIRPLHAVEEDRNLKLLAPNRFVLEWIKDKYLERIVDLVTHLAEAEGVKVVLSVGSHSGRATAGNTHHLPKSMNRDAPLNHGLKSGFTFETFVEGKSNQLARAASLQVAENPGTAYNPLFICGGVGLGKTHCMHAVGNMICRMRPTANVVYLHSERFVADMVKALQHNTINDFKRFYRSVDALLIDDIQFFAGKERSTGGVLPYLQRLIRRSTTNRSNV